MSHLAQWASRLDLPDTHWCLNGCVWVQDDDLAWHCRHSAKDDALTFGLADLMAIKRTRWASGHRLLVIGVVRAERMKCEWLQLKCTTSLNQRVPALFSVTKNPFTINTVIRCPGQWILLPVREPKDVLGWKQPECHYVSEASTSCMKDCCDISYGYYYILPSLLLYQAGAHTRESTEYCDCVLLDVNKNTSLKHRMIKSLWKKKWIPFFTQCSVWGCESRGTARLTGWLSFLTYTDVTQLSRALGG